MAWVKIEDNNECIIDYINVRPGVIGSLIARKVKIKLPEGSIKKLIGRELSWQDDAVELIE